jgi:hypothetical protein
VTVIELNGNAREAAYAEFVADGGNWTNGQVAARLGLGDRQGGTVAREWRARHAANGGSPASEVSLPPKPVPRAIDKKPTATRNHRLVVFAEVAVATVTVVAALMSYSGLRKLALEAGLGWHSDIVPLAVDGLVAVCLFVRVVLPRDHLARAVMWLALAGSVAANAVAYGPWVLPLGYIAAAMAGFVPIAAAVGYYLLPRMLKECR